MDKLVTEHVNILDVSLEGSNNTLKSKEYFKDESAGLIEIGVKAAGIVMQRLQAQKNKEYFRCGLLIQIKQILAKFRG